MIGTVQAIEAITAGGAPAGRTILRHALVLALLFAALSGLYWASVYLVSRQPGMPLDDSYIHLQYARSIVHGHPFEYNPGVRSNGTSAPLWTAMLPLTYLLTGSWLGAAYLLGVLWTIPCVALTYWLIWRWTGRLAWAFFGACVLLLTNPVVVSAYGGMEVPAYVAAFLLGLLLYDLGRTASPDRAARWRLAGSAAFGVGVWLRPEFLMIPALIAAERALTLRRGGGPWRRRWFGEMVGHAAVWLVCLAPYWAFNLWASGTWMPNTFAIKAVVRNSTEDVEILMGLPAALRLRDGKAVLRCLTLWQLLMAVSLVIGLLVNNAVLAWKLPGSIRRGWRGAFGPAGVLAVASLLAFPFARGLIDPIGVFPFQFQRYFGHLTPLMVVLAVGVLALGTSSGRAGGAFVPGRRHWAGAVIAGCLGLAITGGHAVLAVDNINDMQVYTGRWLARHTRPDAVVATNDVGAIAFYGNRRVVDTVGLTEPALARLYLAGGTLEQYLRQVRPQYACLFSKWHDGIARRKDLFDLMFKVKLPRVFIRGAEVPVNVVCGGPTLWVLRTCWNDEFGRGKIDPAKYVFGGVAAVSTRRASGGSDRRATGGANPKGS